MRAQEEEAVRETKRVRRANQRRSEHQRITRPRMTEGVVQSPVMSEPTESDLEVLPFDELEELG